MRRARGNRSLRHTEPAAPGPRFSSPPTSYFFAMLTVSCLRPFRRRRRRTSRPARVFMRLRKPWVRLRLLRWG